MDIVWIRLVRVPEPTERFAEVVGRSIRNGRICLAPEDSSIIASMLCFRWSVVPPVLLPSMTTVGWCPPVLRLIAGLRLTT